MKRLTAFVLALLLTACTRPTEDETVPTEEAQPALLTHVYTETPITIPGDYSYSCISGSTADSVTLLCTRWVSAGEGDSPRAQYENSRYETAEITFYTDGREPLVTEMGDLSYEQYTTAPDGTGYGIANYYDETTGFSGFRLDKITEGEPSVLSDNIAALFGAEDPAEAMFFFPSGLTADEAGRLYIATHQSLVVLNADMTPALLLDNLQSCQGLEKRGDTVYLLYYDTENTGGYALAPILPEEKKLGAPIALPEGVRADSLYLGEGYDVFYLSAGGLWGYNTGDPEGTLLMSMANSNLPNSFSELSVLDSGHFFARYSIGDQSCLSLLTKGEDIDLSEITLLDMAILWVGSSDLNSAVVSYNKAHPDVRILVKDYNALSSPEENGVDRLLREIETGVYTPDLFYLSEEAVIRYLAERNLLADFYPLMEGEEIFHRDNLFGAVKNTYTTGNNLYALPMYLELETVIADKTVVGERDGWTIEECLAISEQMLDAGKYIPGEILMDMGNTVFSFIDWDTYTCSFDTDLFRRFLTYVTGAVQEGERKLTEMNTDPDNRYLPYLNGYLPAAVVEYSRPNQILSDILYFGDNKITIGYPTPDGKGGTRLRTSLTDVFMIAADCTDAAVAWDFIKSAMPEAEDVWRLHGIAAWKHIFDAQIEDESGMYNFVRYDGGMSGSSQDFELAPDGTYRGRPGIKTTLTPEKADAFRNLLENAGSPLPLRGSTEEITAILEEEMSALLAGSCTAADCAARIQSRVSLWLAEHAD